MGGFFIKESKVKISKTLITIILSLLSAGMVLAGARVEFLDHALVDEENLLLGNLAVIITDSAQTKLFLEGIEMGRSPLPGKERSLDSAYLRLRIASKAKAVPDITFSGADKILVRRSFLTVEPEMVIAAVKKHILDHAPWDREDMELAIIKAPKRVIIPKGNLALEVSWPRRADYTGMVNVPVKVIVGQGNYKTTLSVSLRISLFQEVITTAGKLQASHILRPGDVKIERMEVTNIHPQVFTSVEEVLNHKTTSFIAQGKILLRRMIRPVPTVAIGRKVTLQAQVGSVRVVTMGEARSSGLIGEVIPVLNLSSGKIIQGLIIDESVVLAQP